MILQWGVWHINKELMARLRAEKTTEAKRLFRQLDNREFFANALSFVSGLCILLAIVLISFLFDDSYKALEEYFFPFIAITMAILSYWWSDKLRKSAIALIIKYCKTNSSTHKS